MPILNLDAIAPQTIDVEKLDSATGEKRAWKLRADVPTSVLMRCFYLVELEQRRPKVEFDLDAPVDVEEVKHLEATVLAHEGQEEEEALAILGAIWRHTYTGTPDEELRKTLTATERRQILNIFFLLLLARSGKLPSPATPASSSTDSPASSTPETETEPTVTVTQEPNEFVATVMAPHPKRSRTSRAAGSIPSETPSLVALSPRELEAVVSEAREPIAPIHTTTASGVAASIY